MYPNFNSATTNPKKPSPDVDPNSTTNDDVTQYWKIYIAFGYLAQMVPFRLVRKSRTGEFDLKTNIWQKGFCLVMTISSAFIIVAYGIALFLDDKRNGLLFYVEIGNFMSIFIYYWAIWLTFWKKEELIKKLICDVQRNRLISSKFHTPSKIASTRAALACIGLSISIASFSLWTQYRSSKRIYKDALIICQIFRDAESENFLTCACAWIYHILYIYQYYLMHYCDLFVGITSLFFQHVINNFLDSVKKDLYPGQVFKEFIRLKNLVDDINEIIGPFVLIVALANLPFYAQTIGSILYRPELLTRSKEIRILIYFTYNFSMLMMAGNSAKKIHNIKNMFHKIDGNGDQSYLHLHYASPNPTEMSLFLNELNSNEISLSCYGIFNVTTGIIGSICGTLLTYGFLIAQLKSEN